MTPFVADQRIEALAAAQHRVVDRADLLDAGFDAKAIARRVAAGRLTRLHRGVYLVGAPTRWTAEQAALLACGAAAVLSHGSAAAIGDIRPHLPRFVDVTLTSGNRRARAGITVHRATLEPHEVMLRYGLRVTTPLRALTDMATTLGEDDLERAVHEALVLGLVRRGEVEQVRALRRAAHTQPTVSRSELQRAMLALIRRTGLAVPQTEVRIGADTVDFLWPQQRLVVETDGYSPHGTRRRFETDRARDARLVAAGYRVLRFTWRQVTTQPEVVTARLAAALALSVSAA